MRSAAVNDSQALPGETSPLPKLLTRVDKGPFVEANPLSFLAVCVSAHHRPAEAGAATVTAAATKTAMQRTARLWSALTAN
jgi:hypothetical protein